MFTHRVRTANSTSLVVSLVLIAPTLLFTQSRHETPPNFTIAFFGDQGLRERSESVLALVEAEGAHAVVHLGDFDYKDNPAGWDEQINKVLGPDFPYFACVGNHDDELFYTEGGYQQFIEARMRRNNISWEGDLGVKSAFHYKGIFFVLTAPGIFGSGHDVYIREQLARDNSIWRISAWHKNQQLMQVGDKEDETGWGVYEESRKGGAIVATGHEHSYCRSHLLSSMAHQIIASTSDTLALGRDLAATDDDEGKSFAFVSGLGGFEIRDQILSGDWWASIYTKNQDGKAGALFGVFNYNGNPNLARFYFKNIENMVVDSFMVVSGANSENKAPFAYHDDATTPINVPVAIDVTANDHDPDGRLDRNNVVIVRQADNGEVMVGNNGIVTYTPHPGFSGRDAFSYAIGDDQGALSRPTDVTVAVSANLITETQSFPATDDAYVTLLPPGRNYGDETVLNLSTPLHLSYVKFDVSGLSGNVVHAALRLKLRKSGKDGGLLYAVSNQYRTSNHPWHEDKLTYLNAPFAQDPALSSAGRIGTGEIVEFDVSAAIAADSVYSFALMNRSPQPVEYSSREGEFAPTLVVETVALGEGNQPPVALRDFITTMQAEAIRIDVLANDFDPDGQIDTTSLAIVKPASYAAVLQDTLAGILFYTPEPRFAGRDTIQYTVRDKDSALSNLALATIEVAALDTSNLRVFEPSDDAQVKSSRATRNYGDDEHMKVQHEIFRSYLKFNITGIDRAIRKATLRLFVQNESVDGGDIFPVANNFKDSAIPWNETELTWENAPPVLSAPLDNTGPVSENAFTEFDITAAFRSDSTYAFAIITESDDKVEYSTKEGGHSPQLLILLESDTTALESAMAQPTLSHSRTEQESELPLTLALLQNYPNPFNLETKLRYTLPKSAHVRLSIYNARGHLVKILVDGMQTKGSKEVMWDGRDEFGNEVASGVYFLRLAVDAQRFARKLILQK